MYLPRPRIRHPLPVLTEPTREEAQRSRLFSPLRLRSGLELHERTWVPAMVPWRASPEGEVTPEVLAWYERFAQGALAFTIGTALENVYLLGFVYLVLAFPSGRLQGALDRLRRSANAPAHPISPALAANWLR